LTVFNKYSRDPEDIGKGIPKFNISKYPEPLPQSNYLLAIEKPTYNTISPIKSKNPSISTK